MDQSLKGKVQNKKQLKLSILPEFPRKENWLINHKAMITVACN